MLKNLVAVVMNFVHPTKSLDAVKVFVQSVNKLYPGMQVIVGVADNAKTASIKLNDVTFRKFNSS